MAWDFETDPEFQAKLDWMESFVAEKVEPLGYLGFHPYDVKNERRNALVRPLQDEVKAQGLWACHLGPELGGQGYGQVKLGADERDHRRRDASRRSCSAARRPTPATPRSSPTTARPSRRSSTSSRCWTTRSSRASR